MKNKTPFILVNSLNINRGGVTKSALTYANLLAKNYKKVYICTFLYQREYKKIIQTLYDNNSLDKRVAILNMFEDLKLSKNNKKIIHSVKERKFVEFKDNNQKNPSYRYYKDGLYVKYKRFNESGELIFIDYMDGSRQRIIRDEYNSSGLLTRRRHMDKKMKKPRLDQYFDDKEKCFLTTWVNPKTVKETKFVHFSKQPKEYNSLNDFRAMWLNSVIQNVDEPIFMIDKRGLDNLMKEMNHPTLKKVAILHSNHYKKPYEKGSEIKQSYHFLFNNISLFDKIVSLTERQKEDIDNQFNLHNKVEVIPHSVEPLENVKETKSFKYTPNTAISIARYEKEKKLDEAIHAFKLVVEKIPSAKYYIYGTGSQKDNLNELINKLGLQNNVKLKGYTNDSHNKFKEASCSILTSDFEGFGRVVAESLYAGTPVVSYNINYGPSDIIRDNIDGYVVDKGDRIDLATKIIDIFEDNELRERLSKRAVEITDRFSSKEFKTRWLNLLKNL